MFNKLTVEYYGAPTPLQQLASFQNPEARTILVIPFDKSAMHEIEKAHPRLRPRRQPEQRRQPSSAASCPSSPRSAAASTSSSPTTRPRRRRVSVRNIRRKAKTDLDKLVKDGEVGEDDGTRAEKELDGLTKKHTDLVDALSRPRRPSCSRCDLDARPDDDD